MNVSFTQLNRGWNAEPNAPEPSATWQGNDLVLRFGMNPYQFPEYAADDIGQITFVDCSRYRFGMLNDEGWYLGQGRFTDVEHHWGEFYELAGDLRLDQLPDDWQIRIPDPVIGRHYMFYFKDEDFECVASDWRLEVIRAGSA